MKLKHKALIKSFCIAVGTGIFCDSGMAAAPTNPQTSQTRASRKVQFNSYQKYIRGKLEELDKKLTEFIKGNNKLNLADIRRVDSGLGHNFLDNLPKTTTLHNMLDKRVLVLYIRKIKRSLIFLSKSSTNINPDDEHILNLQSSCKTLADIKDSLLNTCIDCVEYAKGAYNVDYLDNGNHYAFFSDRNNPFLVLLKDPSVNQLMLIFHEFKDAKYLEDERLAEETIQQIQQIQQYILHNRESVKNLHSALEKIIEKNSYLKNIDYTKPFYETDAAFKISMREFVQSVRSLEARFTLAELLLRYQELIEDTLTVNNFRILR